MTGHFRGRGAVTVYSGLAAAANIAIMGAVALYTDTPFVFPALGPTIFMLFYSPHDPAASPRNTVMGHAIGIGAGLVGLAAFGLLDGASLFSERLSGERVGAVALSLGLTTALMAGTGFVHPPTGSTTLTVSLGLITELWHVGILEAAVICVVVVAWAFDRIQEAAVRRWLDAGGSTSAHLGPSRVRSSDGGHGLGRELLAGGGGVLPDAAANPVDCREVAGLLDASALGAAESKEVRALREHMADCLRCWDELTEAQRAAALLALLVRLRRAGASLRKRIIGRAGVGHSLARVGLLLSRLRRS